MQFVPHHTHSAHQNDGHIGKLKIGKWSLPGHRLPSLLATQYQHIYHNANAYVAHVAWWKWFTTKGSNNSIVPFGSYSAVECVCPLACPASWNYSFYLYFVPVYSTMQHTIHCSLSQLAFSQWLPSPDIESPMMCNATYSERSSPLRLQTTLNPAIYVYESLEL